MCGGLAKIVLGRWEFGRRMCKDSIKYVGFVRLEIGRAIYELRFGTPAVWPTYKGNTILCFRWPSSKD